jgi:hypothetical protein
MRTALDIVFGVTGQQIYFDAPEGRPSSVTSVTVFRWDQADNATAPESAVGAASVETNPNTATDAVAGTSQSNPKRLPLTLTTNVERERLYLLTDDDTGEHEWVEPLEVATDDYVILRAPLHNDYTSGSTFQSTRMVATIDATWVADSTNLDESSGAMPMYRARWVYVVDGKTRVHDQYFNLVRYAGQHGVTPQDVDSMHPGWLERLPTDHRKDQGRRLITESYRAVKLDMRVHKVTASAVADAEVIDELVRWKAVELCEFNRFLSNKVEDSSRHEAAEQRYTNRLNSFVGLARNVAERTADGNATVRTPLGLTTRR